MWSNVSIFNLFPFMVSAFCDLFIPRTVQLFNFSFFNVTGWGIGLDYHDTEWFALEMNRDHSVAFEIASKYCISDSSVDHDGYSISSEGFLPTVITVKITQSCPTPCNPTRHLCPWDFPGNSTGVDCHFLLQGTSLPKDRTWVSHIVDRCLTVWATREVLPTIIYSYPRSRYSVFSLARLKVFSF